MTLRKLITRIKQAWRLFWLLRETEHITRPALPTLPDNTDWFVWESEQIQRGGYVFWFDHWRYEGQPGAYPDPTPEQRTKVFEMSMARAMAKHGARGRLEKMVADAVATLMAQGFTEQEVFERVERMGQDPVQWAVDVANGKISLH